MTQLTALQTPANENLHTLGDFLRFAVSQATLANLYCGHGTTSIWDDMAALILGILPNVPGFLTTVKALPTHAVPDFINNLYHYAWFVGFIVAGLAYLALQGFNARSNYQNGA